MDIQKELTKTTVNCMNGTWRAHINFLILMFTVNLNGLTGSAIAIPPSPA